MRDGIVGSPLAGERIDEPSPEGERAKDAPPEVEGVKEASRERAGIEKASEAGGSSGSRPSPGPSPKGEANEASEAAMEEIGDSTCASTARSQFGGGGS